MPISYKFCYDILPPRSLKHKIPWDMEAPLGQLLLNHLDQPALVSLKQAEPPGTLLVIRPIASALLFPLVVPRPNSNGFFQVNRTKITPEQIREMKGRQKIASLTTYDFPMTRLLDEAGVPLLLVGDSLGMVILGYPDTTPVTMEEMEHHVRAAARAKPSALLAADLPYRSYQTTEDAAANARRLQAAGAEAVKAEGGRQILPQVRAILSEGIPFLGHIGMLPQSVREQGGYFIKGKIEAEREALMADAKALAETGAFAIVLELVTPPVARAITRAVSIPTIGIGSGPDCDGQILVTSDLVGTFPWFTPKFVNPKLNAAEQMKSAVIQWKEEVEHP